MRYKKAMGDDGVPENLLKTLGKKCSQNRAITAQQHIFMELDISLWISQKLQ